MINILINRCRRKLDFHGTNVKVPPSVAFKLGRVVTLL